MTELDIDLHWFVTTGLPPVEVRYPARFRCCLCNVFEVCDVRAIDCCLSLLAVALIAAAPVIRAEEGMWTFDNPPLKQLAAKYNFHPTQEWLDHLRLSSVRLNDGGSGSFVSPDGLLLTNHHVARGQLQKNSTAEHDYLREWFLCGDAGPGDEVARP